jgi:hypothetical protein
MNLSHAMDKVFALVGAQGQRIVALDEWDEIFVVTLILQPAGGHQ